MLGLRLPATGRDGKPARDLARYPPPEPIIGEGPRHRVGAWTASNVREVLDNPKHTGYMVWNRRKRPRLERGIRGKVNPPSAWVWSALPTHEPLVTREIFEAASTVARFRQGSRSDAAQSPIANRTYLLRTYLHHTLCDRRMWGHTVHQDTYYRCTPKPHHHAHHPWFNAHPPHVTAREDEIVPLLNSFFERRILGAGRTYLLAQSVDQPAIEAEVTERAEVLTNEIANLQRRQNNLVTELEHFEPSGDDDFDQAWRSGIQDRFRTILADLRKKKDVLADLTKQSQTQPQNNPALLESVPQTSLAVSRLPEEQQRRLFDAFHLELRYNDLTNELDIRVTITGETATTLGATVEAVLDSPNGIPGGGDPVPGPSPAPDGLRNGPQPLADDLCAGPLRARGGSRKGPQRPPPKGTGQLVIQERLKLQTR